MVTSTRIACNIFFYGLKYLEPCAYLSHTATIWMTFLLAVSRYVAVCMPLNAGKILTMGKAKLQVCVVFMFSIVFYIPRFFQWNLTVHIDEATNETVIIQSKSSIGYGSTVAKVYTNALYNLVVVLLPLTLLIILNVKLIREINIMKELRSSLTHGSPNKDQNVTTIMVVIIVVVIVGHLPDRILQIFRSHTSTKFMDCIAMPYYFLAVANLLIILHSSTNFLVYYILRKSFRNILIAKLCHKHGKGEYRPPSSTNYPQAEIKMLSTTSEKTRMSM